MSRAAAAILLAVAIGAAQRRVRPEELPVELRALDLSAIEAESQRRVAEGERDHAIFYALQSERFTKLPRVEPSRSAKAFVDAGRIPEDAAARLRAFAATKPVEARHTYFRGVIDTEERARSEYERAMRFLYEKEWKSRERTGAERRGFIAGLYQSRGHSSDSSAEANYAVHAGLRALREMAPEARVRRVLLIGPGMDIAPRSGLRDEDPPRSLQPFVLADSLIRSGLAEAKDLTIDCADVNPRVARHLREFRDSPRRIRIGVAPGDEEWNAFFAGIGPAIGLRMPGGWIEVSTEIAARVNAFEMNIVTQRPEPGAVYDLAVATNVLLYCNREELGLAFANIAAALAPGGHLLHNDTRNEVERWGRVTGLEPVHARMVRLGSADGRALFDSAVLHAKR